MNNDNYFVSKYKAQERYNICKKCEYLLPTTNCQKCGCFMKFKVKIKVASCPINKW